VPEPPRGTTTAPEEEDCWCIVPPSGVLRCAGRVKRVVPPPRGYWPHRTATGLLYPAGRRLATAIEAPPAEWLGRLVTGRPLLRSEGVPPGPSRDGGHRPCAWWRRWREDRETGSDAAGLPMEYDTTSTPPATGSGPRQQARNRS